MVSMLILGAYLMRSLEIYFVNNLRNQLLIEASLIGQMVEEDLLQGSTEGKAYLFSEFAQDLVNSTKVKTGTRITIIDNKGIVWGDSAEDPKQMENHLDRPEIQDALRHGEGWSTRHSYTLNSNMMYVAIPVKIDDKITGFVRLAVPLTEVEQTVHRLWGMILFAAILGLVLAGIIGLLLARKATRPIEEMTRAAEEISRGNFVQKCYSTGSDELGVLANSLNSMALTLKQTLDEVVAGKTRLESVLASMVSGVIFIGPAGKVDLINPAALDILSINCIASSKEKKYNFQIGNFKNNSNHKLIGKPHSVIIRHYMLSNLIEEVMCSRQPRRDEIQILTPVEKIIEVYLSPIIGPEEQNLGIVVVLHDITELRHLERIRSDFVANVSHELKTPVTSVQGFAETLLEGALDDRSVAEEFVRIIYQEAKRLTALINDLLQLSKIELRPETIKLAPLELVSFIKKIANKFGPAIQAHNHQLELHLPSEKIWALANEERLEQVFDNLLDNAIKYTPSGGVITLELQVTPEEVLINVCDTGIGINPEERKRIFERFYRVDKARSRKVGGTGLGLSIVKHILEAHGTSIEVTDGKAKGLNKGTCFNFRLKRIADKEEKPEIS